MTAAAPPDLTLCDVASVTKTTNGGTPFLRWGAEEVGPEGGETPGAGVQGGAGLA